MTLQQQISTGGLRRTTRSSRSAQQLSRAYESRSVRSKILEGICRTKALQIAKRAAAALGLKSTKIALIDQLFAFSKPCDWKGCGGAPVVWPSNALLARRMGIAVSTVRYHLRGLTDAGLIAYNDHPTYQRSGRRDAEGSIIQAFGINLAPIAMRFDELTELVDRVENEAIVWRSLSHRRTVLRKEITSMLVSPSDWDIYHTHASAFIARLDGLREAQPNDVEEFYGVIRSFEKLRDDIEILIDGTEGCQDLSTTVSSFEQHTTTDIPTTPVSGSKKRYQVNAQSDDSQDGFSKEAFETKLGGTSSPSSSRLPIYKQRHLTARHSTEMEDVGLSLSAGLNPQTDLRSVSLSLVRAACTDIFHLMPEAFVSWRALRNAGPTIMPIIVDQSPGLQ
ncbi:plasmid replication protein RepC [Phyllobacterium sp. TAF24]|uniref:plasmid replication protein RepC n=1 Tax=Phyllobacterium sp. TAF24 TaxID=3233068 RepID=UPI003F9DE69C